MNTAVITMVYNEAKFLPLWLDYYGSQFGRDNLLVIDNCSEDGSTSDLGDTSRLVIPRNSFDDHRRARMVSKLHASLLEFYDAVIYTDVDEFLFPPPDHSTAGLRAYLDNLDRPYATSIGLNVQ